MCTHYSISCLYILCNHFPWWQGITGSTKPPQSLQNAPLYCILCKMFLIISRTSNTLCFESLVIVFIFTIVTFLLRKISKEAFLCWYWLFYQSVQSIKPGTTANTAIRLTVSRIKNILLVFYCEQYKINIYLFSDNRRHDLKLLVWKKNILIGIIFWWIYW